jgi:hypothetical protein
MKTRTESYGDGFHTGRRWAEEDITNHEPVDAIAGELTKWYARNQRGELARAFSIGVVRGYRDTVDRFERGVLTKEMFDTVPLDGS